MIAASIFPPGSRTLHQPSRTEKGHCQIASAGSRRGHVNKNNYRRHKWCCPMRARGMRANSAVIGYFLGRVTIFRSAHVVFVYGCFAGEKHCISQTVGVGSNSSSIQQRADICPKSSQNTEV